MSSQLQHSWETAHGAFIDGRLDNLVFKHKQLYALFETLQTEGLKVLQETKEPAQQLALELENTLRSISDALDALPHNVVAEFDKEQKFKDIRRFGARKRAVGVIAIVADRAHPFASWAIPLSQAIVDGNPALVFVPPASNLIPSALRKHVDSAGYQVHEVASDQLGAKLASLPEIAGLVGPASLLPKSVSTKSDHLFQLRPLRDGPVPILVDQSILPGGIPLSVKAEAQGHVPHSVTVVAKHIAASLALRDQARPSLGTPTYLLAHENVVQPLLRALGETLPPGLTTQLTPLAENKPKIKAFLEAQQAGVPSFLPVYAVRSLDMAIDFVQDDVSTPALAYVFAEHRFAVYAFNSLKAISSVHLNRIPELALALGPYAERESFTIDTKSHVSVVHKPASHPLALDTSIERIKGLKARKLVQKPGHRIDFFGGSFLFAGSMTASLLLGGVGYGLYRGVALLWSLRSR